MQGLFNAKRGAAIAALLITASTPAGAQNDANTSATTETAKTNAETDRLKAEAGKINAQADLERAKVSAIGLPTYAGSTKLNTGAGEMEAMLLTGPAVRLGGSKIADAVPAGDNVLLLTRDDTFDFGLVGSITAEMDGLRHQYEALGTKPSGPLQGKFIPGAIAVISAIAGIMRSETEVTAANVSVSDLMLLTAVAAKLRNRARLPASAIGTVQVASDGTNSPLLALLGNIATLDDRARIQRHVLEASNGGNPDEDAKGKIAEIDTVRKRYDSFFSRIVTVDAQGAVPIARVARLELLMADINGVLRVHVEKSGGSLINTKNIATFFGTDPVRVTGGLVVSFLLTRPSDGAVTNAGIIQCRTAMARLRKIQEGTVMFRSKVDGKAVQSPRVVCEGLE